jgi:hypothetical protein
MRIKSHAPLMFLGMTAAGLMTLALVGTYFYLMWAAGRASTLVYVFVSPFMLMGSLLAFFGGRTFLRMAWLGQPLLATLFPRRAVTPTGELQCRLRCIRVVRRQVGGSTSSDTTTLWQSSWTRQAATIHPTLGVELSLPLPETGQPTAVDRLSGSGTIWQLNVVIPSQGSSEEPVFDLPVRH